MGDAKSPVRIDEIVELLADPQQSVVVNLLGMHISDRPGFLAQLLPRLVHLRATTARPHWLVIDEAHHLLPSTAHRAPPLMLRDAAAAPLLVTVDPEHIATNAVQGIEYLLAVGANADHAIASSIAALGEPALAPYGRPLDRGQALFWSRSSPRLRLVTPIAPHQEHQRHIRKYAEGELGEDNSFYFRGPDGALNLRAQNLALFTQIADGVDDRTWEHHLRVGDYSRWFRDKIKDEELADEAAETERDRSLSPSESRHRVRSAINRRYTLPA